MKNIWINAVTTHTQDRWDNFTHYRNCPSIHSYRENLILTNENELIIVGQNMPKRPKKSK
jgi:hypothetical protein